MKAVPTCKNCPNWKRGFCFKFRVKWDGFNTVCALMKPKARIMT